MGFECDDEECALPLDCLDDEDEDDADVGPPPIERLRAKVASSTTEALPLDTQAAADVVAFLNEHLADEMLDWVLKGTEVGATAAKKNAWSARSFVPKAAELTALTGTTLTFSVRVEERGSPSPTLSA